MHNDLGHELFGSFWKGIDSDSSLLQDIVQWHQQFIPLYNTGMYSENVFNIIEKGCHKAIVIELIESSKILIDPISKCSERILSKMNTNKGLSSSLTDLIHAAVASLKYIRLKQADSQAYKIFGIHWKSASTDLTKLRQFTDWVLRFKKAQADNILTLKALELFDVADIDKNRLAEHLELLIDCDDIIEQIKNINRKLGTSEDKIDAIIECAFEDVSLQLGDWVKNISSLATWNDYLRERANCKHQVSKLLINELEKGTIEKGSDIIHILFASYADSLLKAAFKNYPELMNFNSSVHAKRIERFNQFDRKIILLNRHRLQEKLNITRPKLVTNASSNSEVGFLLGEIHKKRAHKSIRQVLLRAGNLIQKIKPCFLMSPLSIAQFLDPQTVKFDTIIFDEASQVRPEDAIGSLMRGNQLVVMGDSKQLPPTTFFDHMVDDDLDIEDNDTNYTSVVNFESILHQCITQLPRKYLNWHYRSRHESLILVSNSFFYDNRLQVFPSPFSKDSDIGLHYIHLSNSIYDRGNTSVNRIEAKYIVELACSHYKQNPELSLGIGTFSAKQQDAIINELEFTLRARPEIQSHFSKDNPEHFFVKNLETIQGDERDVIIISVGYGFDVHHNLSMNFGPLNQEGGHRRLNVLITRARRKCIVVSNFRASDLKDTASPTLGITALKAYLQYADTGEIANVHNDHDSDSPFEDSVYDYLLEKGYNVVKQVGCARFKIDMAITHPKNTSQYLLGIECDGAMYHSSPTARERDRLRQEILENLGWTIYRIWSTDWYRNGQKCKDNLISAIEHAIIDPHKQLPDSITKVYDNPSVEYENNDIVRIDDSMSNESINNSYSFHLDEYVYCDTIDLYSDYELHKMPLGVLVKAILAIVEIESPIHREDVITRIRSLAGYEKTGSRIHKAINEAIDFIVRTKQIRARDNFLWDKMKRDVAPRHRVSMINISRICGEEIEAVIRLVLENQLSTEKHDLCVQVSRLFGIQRLTSESEDRINDIISIMFRKKLLRKSNTNFVQLAN